MKPTEPDETTTDRSIRTDGGDDESPFDTVSKTQITKRERLRRRIDESVLAPLRIMWTDWRARLGITILSFYAFMGVFGPWLVAQPRPNQGPTLSKPFAEVGIGEILTAVTSANLGRAIRLFQQAHPLGTDRIGNDILSMIVYGTRPMAEMIFVGAVVATGIAVVLGTLSGYKGGQIETIIMFASDVMITIPGLPFTIVLAAILQPREPAVVGALLSIDGWPGLTRALRSQVLTLRDESYVEASRTMGLSTPTILRRDILPNVLPYVFVNFVNSARGIIYGSVALYFLGVLPFTTQNWGVILNGAYSYGGVSASASRHWLAAPMLTIVVISFGLIMLAQGTDRIFNPRIRARHEKTAGGGAEDADAEAEDASVKTVGGV